MSTIINGIGRVGIRVAPTSGGGGYTTRTTAFAAATGIADTTILNALNTFDLGLISNGIDTKMKALYPMVGGTATTHKFNFMDARDLDAAFRLQFNGGWVHSSTGAKPNGTNAYANTFLIPLNDLLLNSSHLSFYSRTNSSGIEIELGSEGSSGASVLEIRTSGTTYYRINSGGSYISSADADSRAFYIANRTASNAINGWRNNSKIATGTVTSSGLSSFPNYISSWNSYGANIYHSIKECAFASQGNGLTDGEATTFYSLVQAMQTSLSRAV